MRQIHPALSSSCVWSGQAIQAGSGAVAARLLVANDVGTIGAPGLPIASEVIDGPPCLAGTFCGEGLSGSGGRYGHGI